MENSKITPGRMPAPPPPPPPPVVSDWHHLLRSQAKCPNCDYRAPMDGPDRIVAALDRLIAAVDRLSARR